MHLDPQPETKYSNYRNSTHPRSKNGREQKKTTKWKPCSEKEFWHMIWYNNIINVSGCSPDGSSYSSRHTQTPIHTHTHSQGSSNTDFSSHSQNVFPKKLHLHSRHSCSTCENPTGLPQEHPERAIRTSSCPKVTSWRTRGRGHRCVYTRERKAHLVQTPIHTHSSWQPHWHMYQQR